MSTATVHINMRSVFESSHIRRFVALGAVLVSLLSMRGSTQAAPFTVKSFSPWSGYAIPDGVWLTGDFNGDGKSDIFHAVANTDYANVWLSKGDGTFSVSSFSPWAGYAIPDGVWLVGDFNGDGKSDVFHAVAGTDYANIWLSKGDGTFDVKSFSPWNGYAIPDGVWLVGDFNGDGKSDIFHAVAGTDYANIWLSKGDGTFDVKSFSPWKGYAIPNGVWLVGDFNGDGKSDILHAVAGTDHANVWLSKGDGTFDVKSFSPWSGYAIPNGDWLVGDFNGDGKSDILHAVAGTDYANVWLSKGDGTFDVKSFSPWSGYAIPNGVWLVGDFDGDGKSDIFHAVANTDYANLWLSKGDGTFNVSSYSPWAGYAIPNGLWLTGNIIGNGKTDVIHAVQNTDYINSWISVFPTPGQVAVDGIEITQAIQDMQQTVTLVADKQTWARAYLSINSTQPLTVRGVLTARNTASGVTTTINSTSTTTINPVQNGQIRPKRESITGSLNFIIPANFTAAGSYEFTLTSVIPSPSGAALGCANCGFDDTAVSFVASAPMRVRMIGLQYTAGTPPNTVVFAPRAIDFTLLQSWLQRAYPIAQLFASQTTVNATATPPFTSGSANSQIASIRANDINNGADSRTHYIGLVESTGGGGSGFYMRGSAASIPTSPDPSVVCSAPTGSPTGPGSVPVNVSGDTDASYGDWYGGHELAHTFGRFHPGFCNGNSADDSSFPYPNGQISDNAGTFCGLDVGDAANGINPAVLPGAARYDIMTYCNQPQWLSAYAYEGVQTRLNAEDPSGNGPAGQPAPSPGPRLRISSGVEFDPAHPHEPLVMHGLAARPKVITALDRSATPIVGREAPPGIPQPSREAPKSPDSYFIQGPYQPNPAPAATKPAEIERPIMSLAQAAVETNSVPMAKALKNGNFVSIIATVNLTRNSAKIQYANRVSRAMIPGQVVDPRASLQVTDATGKAIGSYPVAILEDTDIPAGEDRTALIDAVIPDLATAAAVELVLSGKIVDRIQISKHAPVVTAANIAKAQPGEVTLTWQGSHPDGAKLTYMVQISSDQGKTWQTIAIGMPETNLTLTSNQVNNRLTNQIRVTANDGYNSSPPVTLELAPQE